MAARKTAAKKTATKSESTSASEETSQIEAKDTAVSQPEDPNPVPTYEDSSGVSRIAGPKAPAYETPSLEPDPDQVERAKERAKAAESES